MEKSLLRLKDRERIKVELWNLSRVFEECEETTGGDGGVVADMGWKCVSVNGLRKGGGMPCRPPRVRRN